MPSLTSYPLTCEFDRNCNKVTCCVESELTNSTFEATMDINPCTKTLHLAVENLEAKIPFSEIAWGMYDVFFKI